MNDKSDLAFMGDFPHLQDWLNLNGFSLIFSNKNPELNMIFSAWSDRSALPSEHATDAKNWIMINYCMECKTVEIYSRVFIGRSGDDESLENILAGRIENGYTDLVKETLEAEEECEENYEL